MNLEPRVAMKAMNELARQADELDGKRRILAIALKEIEDIAADHADYDTDGWNRVLHICNTRGVREAMSE